MHSRRDDKRGPRNIRSRATALKQGTDPIDEKTKIIALSYLRPFSAHTEIYTQYLQCDRLRKCKTILADLWRVERHAAHCLEWKWQCRAQGDEESVNHHIALTFKAKIDFRMFIRMQRKCIAGFQHSHTTNNFIRISFKCWNQRSKTNCSSRLIIPPLVLQGTKINTRYLRYYKNSDGWAE